MFLQDGGGDLVGNWAFHSVLDGDGFAGIGDAADDVLAFHDLVDRHGDGLCGDIVECGEPALAELLFSAGIIEVDNEEGFLGVEVGGRVVEGEVPVFTDADKGDVDGMVADDVAQPRAFLARVGLAFDPVGGGQGCGELGNEAVFQVFAERSGMGFGDAQVFIEVEEGDLVPCDVGLVEEVFEYGELGGAGGEDEVGVAEFLDGGAEVVGTMGGGGVTHGLGVRVDGDLHGVQAVSRFCTPLQSTSELATQPEFLFGAVSSLLEA